MDERLGPRPDAPNPYAPNPYAGAPNPYAAPVSDAGPGWMPGLDDDHMLASPWTRLGASILDNFFYLLVAIPVVLLAADLDALQEGRVDMGFYLSFGLPMLAAAAVQWYLIATTGQSIGKKLVGVKIIKTTGEDVNFVSGVILRSWITAAISQVPLVGGIFGLVDVLFIFGSDHRCIHDLIAGTKVISV